MKASQQCVNGLPRRDCDRCQGEYRPVVKWQRFCKRCQDSGARVVAWAKRQPTLFDPPQFDGHTYDPALDEDRLSKQLGRVYDLMSDGCWRTLWVIQLKCGGSEAGISARLRDLKKAKFGSYTMEKRRVPNCPGLWEYRMVR